MLIESHATLIGSLRQVVNEWRRREGISRETVAQLIVEAHESIGADKITGIRFDPSTRDTFERMKVNADRIFRWLDDDSKDTNFLPSNFLPSVLAAVPVDLRMMWLNDYLLRPLGLGAHGLDVDVNGGVDVHAHLRAMLKEDSEAQQAVAELMADSSPDALAKAHKEVTESIEANQRVRRVLEAGFAKVRTVMHFPRGGQR